MIPPTTWLATAAVADCGTHWRPLFTADMFTVRTGDLEIQDLIDHAGGAKPRHVRTGCAVYLGSDGSWHMRKLEPRALRITRR